MIKVIIVDDEYLEREGMRDLVEWDKYGMEVVGVAKNGAEGLELFHEKNPDLVITDIGMPIMDGMEMTEKIILEVPSTEVIILTCYDEFGYARKALQLNCFDYILKPVDFKDLEIILLNVKEKIRKKYQTIKKFSLISFHI